VDEQAVSVGGREIAYRASDGTGQAVILVHGNSSSARTWQGLLDSPFGERYRCLALDLPGHGQSPPIEARAAGGSDREAGRPSPLVTRLLDV
jgi:pimeloyl-ACP methyl ester carboxylesterase